MLRKSSRRPVRKIKISGEKSGQTRREREALQHVEEGWIPVQPEVLAQVQTYAEAGLYEEQPEILIEQIKKDPGLFFFLAKNLKKHVSPDDRVIGFDPITQLRKLEGEKVGIILSVSPEDIAPHHSRETPSPSQHSQQQLAKLSATTAETLAAKLPFESDHAYSNAIFRHLGRELIAWNYPHIFSRALSLHKTKGEPIDGYLKRTIGISPSELSLRYARMWGMSSQIERTINYRSPEIITDRPTGASMQEPGSMSLGELCNMSELFARSKDPTNFPKAEDQWAARESALRETFGDEVIEELEHNAEQIITAEENEETTIAISPKEQLRRREEKVYQQNHYLRQLPGWLRSIFFRAYEEITGTELALDALRLIAHSAVPEAGFVRGCLYLENKETTQLEPALRFGDVALNQYKTFLMDARNGIATSLHTTAPTKKEGQGIRGEHIIQISGSLKNKHHPGVLYLEVGDSAESNPGFDAIMYFHAVRQAISDCLAKT